LIKEPRQPPAAGLSQPFDRWLSKQLHAMYDAVASRPSPKGLIKLLDHEQERSPD
jgi:hypothetical protein